MRTSTLFRNWWVILIQGILMIVLSILIFKNPDTVLAALAFWLGVVVIITGLYGLVAYFATSKEDRDIITLLGSIAMCLIGLMMVSKMIITMIAITLSFGVLVAVIGLQLMWGSWKARNIWPLWWVIALTGVAALIMGVKSMIDIQSGAQTISTLIGISVLLSGIGLICLAFLKRAVVNAVRDKINKIRS